MTYPDPSGTNGPWRKYRCACGYRCVGDYMEARHEHEMKLDGVAHGERSEWFEDEDGNVLVRDEAGNWSR